MQHPSTRLPETVFLSNKKYEERGQKIYKLIGFGFDGSYGMTGIVRTRVFREFLCSSKQPHVIHIHCMAHRLALCTSQAAIAVKPVRMYQELSTSLYYYCRKSASRDQEHNKLQTVLDSPTLNPLPHDAAY